MTRANELLELMEVKEIPAKITFDNDDFELVTIVSLGKEMKIKSKKAKKGDKLTIAYADGKDLKELDVKVLSADGKVATIR